MQMTSNQYQNQNTGKDFNEELILPIKTKSISKETVDLRTATIFESTDLLEICGVLENNILLHIGNPVRGNRVVYFQMANEKPYYVTLYSQWQYENIGIVYQILTGIVSNHNLDAEKRATEAKLFYDYQEKAKCGVIIKKTQYQINIDVLQRIDLELALKYVLTTFKVWLQLKGKTPSISPEEVPTYKKLFAYIIASNEACETYKIDKNKGLLLLGPVGVGKTSFFNFFNWFRNSVFFSKTDDGININYGAISYSLELTEPIIIKTCNDVVETFLQANNEDTAKKVIDRYKHNAQNEYLFDDLGVENFNLNRFGNIYNVMSDIFSSRYELHEKTNAKTHITSNLQTKKISVNGKEFLGIRDIYGDRVADRIKSMCNIIFFPQHTQSKRK